MTQNEKTDYKESDVLAILKETEAFLQGHFLLSSGLHSDTYIQCAKVLQYPKYAELFGRLIANQINTKIDLVVSPALGGIIIGYEVARTLKVPFIFTEREESGDMTLRRGQKIDKGLKVVIVEDVITTGKSSLEVAKVVNESEGEVVLFSCIVNRSEKSTLLDRKIISLVNIKTNIYTPDVCPLCKKGYELVKPGSRKSSK
jgi:orotate phosphoribosyltransferase